MDRDIWVLVTKAVECACRQVRGTHRKLKFGDELIVKMYLWSVWHDRCLSWACDSCHYGNLFRPRKLPSISQFTRRVGSPLFQTILGLVHVELARDGFHSPVLMMDGKPIPVSPVSKDPDARSGHITGGFAKGYKLHAVISECRKLVMWSVMPLNTAEQSVAMEMSSKLEQGPPLSLMLADSNYDSAPLHKVLGTKNRRLLTPLKGQKRVKNGVHHPVTQRQMGPLRREAVAVTKEHPDLVKYVLKQRNNIEGVFSVLTVALHLSHAPAWVRGTTRVRRWAGAKIILYNARVDAQKKLAAQRATPAPETLVA